MKIFILAIMLTASVGTYGQAYLQQDIGYAFKKEGGKALIMNLHAGYQFNKIILTQGVALAEYNQRVLIGGGLNPVYLGGRIGYGYAIDESVIVALWGAEYYRLAASGVKNLNYWIPGYGVSVSWKSVALDVSNVDVLHISIGCRYLFD